MNPRTLAAGLLPALALAAAMALWPGVFTPAREQAADLVSQLSAPAPEPGVVVVDIDDAAAAKWGSWPWPRARMAELLDAIADAEPAGIGLDIVLSGNCDADREGNAALATAIGRTPTFLGFVLPGPDPAPAPTAAFAARDAFSLPGLWQSDGAEMPCPQFVEQAWGVSAISLSGDGAARVRSVPALVSVAATLFPGLAVDMARIRFDVGTLILSDDHGARLDIGSLVARLDTAGEMRLQATGPDQWAARTMSASDVAVSRDRLKGALVIVGASLAELGTLRPTAASPLAPSIQIEADALSGLMAQRQPWRPSWAPVTELLLLLAGAVLATLAALRLRPAATATTVAILILLAITAATGAYHMAHLVIDPLFPALGILLSGIGAGLAQYSASRRTEAAIRTSFEQRLPPAVVAQLAAGKLRLAPEERVVTALFTDIEGFTSLTSRAGPHELVRLLNDYFDGVTRIIHAHGGMIDKIVGDAVHAFFNMPLPLPGHEARALACAAEILAFSETYGQRPEVARFQFGRTRIGVETGQAVVGDVGSRGKFDYSAHGDAVNRAARLQDANKRTGTSILAGPGIRSAAPPGWRFESLGTLDMQGLGAVEVFVPQRED